MMLPPLRSAIIFASHRQLFGLGRRPLFGVMLAGFAVPLRLGHFDGCRFLGVSLRHDTASALIAGPVAHMPSLGRHSRPRYFLRPSDFTAASFRSFASRSDWRWRAAVFG